MANQPDANPNAGSKKGGGMKNQDGREKGSSYNKQDKAPFNAKHTCDPNEDAPSLGSAPGLEEGAY